MNRTIHLPAQAVDAHRDTILSAERHIWANPETGYKEWKTHAFLKEEFEKLGYAVNEAGNIPDRVTVESYVRGATIDVLARENLAFADSLCLDQDAVCHHADGTVSLSI